jgi:sulfide:quinone oxidoreductase
MALDGATITVIDGRKEHWYQPGFTLVAAGIKPQDYVVSQTRDYVPRGVEWVTEAVAEIDPVGNKVVTAGGRTLPYDFLIVATGLELNYNGIEGMDTARIGQNGLGSIYHSPQAAAATWQAMSAVCREGRRGPVRTPGGRNEVCGCTPEVHLHHRRPPAPPPATGARPS